MRTIIVCLFILIIVVVFTVCGGSYRQSDEMTAQRRLFNNRCSSCHIAPSKDDKTAEAWAVFLKDHAANAGLDDDQLAIILKYLQTNAKKR